MSAALRPPVDGGTVLITGASAGIGRELAVQLAPRAATLVLLARRVARLEQLQAEFVARHPDLRVVVLSADLSDEHDVERVLAEVGERVGHVDVLVNNAGFWGLGAVRPGYVVADPSGACHQRRGACAAHGEGWFPAWWPAAGAVC